METNTLREIKFKLPVDLVETFTVSEIISLLSDKALSKAEYYLSRCREFEEKYHFSLEDFKRKVEGSQEEIFSDWDNLLVWEGYYRAYQDWQKKYEELKDCRA